jgi:hypothetical protein
MGGLGEGWITVGSVDDRGGMATDGWCSDGKRTLVPYLAGALAVSHPPVVFVSGLGAAAQCFGDLAPCGPVCPRS